MHAWRNYKKYAYGKDFLKPLSKSGKDEMGLGLTLIDSMDTMLIMNLQEEFKEARGFVEKLKFERKEVMVSASELNTRVLGSFLSVYSITGDEMFLNKAKEVGEILYEAWDQSHPLPYSFIDFQTMKGAFRKYKNGSVILSEAGSYTMEFCTLSYLTKDEKYCKIALQTVKKLLSFTSDGIVFSEINFNDFSLHQKETLGEGKKKKIFVLKIKIKIF